jgi:hypothetical protein
MKALLATLLALSTLAAAPALAGPSLRSTGNGVTIALEGEAGQSLPTYYHRGVTYVMGDMGGRYNVRVTNGSNERVEVVLTVDGRDAISGENGDWRNQRGYIVPPYGSIVVDGFRKNYSEVAAFRFTTRGDSYSGRRGTPQNAGVIGAAVFREAFQRPQAIAPPPQPYPHPGWGHHRDFEFEGDADKKDLGGLGTGSGGGGYAERREAPTASAPAEDASQGAADMARSETAARGEAMAAPKGKTADSNGPHGGGYSARPAPRKNNLGTQYGESRYSPVSETAFRRRGGSPDSILGLYYDDAAGLAARGIAVYPEYSSGGPQPFPTNRRFAPPPP